MRAALHINNLGHQQTHGAAMKAGLERHGITVTLAGYDQPVPCDFAVIWGAPARHPNVARRARRCLVMEAGHIGGRNLTRLTYTSCSWDGLARRGRYPKASDGGERWRRLYEGFMQPWKPAGGDYALLIGQVEGDAALYHLREGFETWRRRQADALVRLGYKVQFRPHPHVQRPQRTLEQDLAHAAICVTYNSTAGVEAVLAGVPTITMDPGAMAWDVTTHNLTADPIRPDRTTWAHDLAWTSWRLDEIAAGDAWAALAPIMEPA